MKQFKTNVIKKKELRESQLNALRTIADTLYNAFGPYALATSIKTPETKTDQYGVTIYTKDGMTIVENLLMNLPIEMSVREDVKNIARDTVKKVGDGTTAACILSYLIFKWLVKANEEFNIPEKVLVDDLRRVTKKVISHIQAKGREATEKDMFDIAMISTNGNYEVSKAIYEIYQKHGMGVHIDTGISNTENHVLKEFDGISFNQGYWNEYFINNPDENTSEITNPKIYVFEDPVDSKYMRAFFDKILVDNIFEPMQLMSGKKIPMVDPKTGNNITDKNGMVVYKKPRAIIPTVIFSSAYGTDMKSMADELLATFRNYPPEMRPPLLSVTNIHDIEALQDLCTLTGATIIKKYISEEAEKYDQERGRTPTFENIHEFAGGAEKVVASSTSTKVINPYKMYETVDDGKGNVTIKLDENGRPVNTEIYNELLRMVEQHIENLKKDKKDLKDLYLATRRLHRLKGNLVEYLVGGVAIADRDYVRDLVEDAVLNCRSAAEEGVGYGANFEAFRALNEITKEENTPDPYKEYSMEGILLDVYTTITCMLYESAFEGNTEEAKSFAVKSIQNGCPANLAELKIVSRDWNEETKSWTHKISTESAEYVFSNKRPVLSSIKSDQVVLNAISRIIGTSFATNQYFTPMVEMNGYADSPIVVATQEK